MTNSSERMTISGHTCAACQLPIAKGSAVLRGDLRTVSAYHRDCFTVHRAVREVVVAEIAEEIVGGTLSERLARAGLA